MVPPSFEAFARVLHPLSLRGTQHSWRELAEMGGQPMHPIVRGQDLLAEAAGRPVGNWVYSGQGSPPPEREWQFLIAELLRHTRSTALVLGYSDIFGVPWPQLAGRFELSGNRAFFLAELTTAEVTRPVVGNHGFMPQLAWLPDAAWFVHTEIEDFSTYVGGSAAAIEGVLGCPGLEAFPVQPGDPV